MGSGSGWGGGPWGRGTDHRGPERSGLHDRDPRREIDTATVTRLRETPFRAGSQRPPVVVDLDQVSLHRLGRARRAVGTAKRAAAHGGSLRPAADPPAVPADRTGPPGYRCPTHGRGPGSPGCWPGSHPASSAEGPDRSPRSRGGGGDRKAMRSGERLHLLARKRLPPHEWAMPWGRAGFGHGARISHCQTPRQPGRSRALALGGSQGESGRCRCCGSATAAAAGTPRTPTA